MASLSASPLTSAHVPRPEPVVEPENVLTPEQVDEAMDSIYARGDHIIKKFVLMHALLSIALAFFYQTWLISLLVGGAATAMFFISVTLLPRSFITRCVAGIAMQTFVALHIYQLHGLAEMHFFFFTAFTMLIVYQDWKSMWPGTILIILQHTMFAALHNAGVDLYFFEDSYIGVTKLFFHFSLAAAQVGIAGYWAHLLRQSTLRDAVKKLRLQQAMQLQQEAREEAERHARAAEIAHREAEEARVEAERANAAKSEFLSRMSHELRTPLNAILGFGQLLEMSEKLDKENREFAGLVVGGGQHLLELINEILDVARVESGNLEVSLEPVAVREAVRESLDLMRPLAAKRDIEIDAAALEDCAARVLADRQRFKQVLLNLLSNAVKYNRDGGCVTLEVQEIGTKLRILVADTGNGIAPADLEKLFVPFERLNAGRTAIEGTGLGLAFSKRLVEAMEGAIGVKSVVGQGSTFWIELPLAAGTPRVLASPQEAARPSETASPKGVATGTLLYIEDNSTNLQLVRSVLSQRPHVSLHYAERGRDGLELAKQLHPNLILLDVHLPDMMGDEVLRELKGDASTREIPVVALSADATPAQIGNVMREGAVSYLTKPFDVREFLEVLDNLLPTQDAAMQTAAQNGASQNSGAHAAARREIDSQQLAARLRI